MAQMFEHLQTASRLNDDGSYPTCAPTPDHRTDRGRSLAWAHWPGATKAPRRPHPAILARHMLMAARAKVLMDPSCSFIAALTSPAVTPAHPL